MAQDQAACGWALISRKRVTTDEDCLVANRGVGSTAERQSKKIQTNPCRPCDSDPFGIGSNPARSPLPHEAHITLPVVYMPIKKLYTASKIEDNVRADRAPWAHASLTDCRRRLSSPGKPAAEERQVARFGPKVTVALLAGLSCPLLPPLHADLHAPHFQPVASILSLGRWLLRADLSLSLVRSIACLSTVTYSLFTVGRELVRLKRRDKIVGRSTAETTWMYSRAFEPHFPGCYV